MTFNDLFNGCTGAGAKFNLLKDYPLGSGSWVYCWLASLGGGDDLRSFL